MSWPGDAELERLEAFLLDHMESAGSMPLDAAHGFLTAVVSGPRQILPEAWLPRVLGDIQFGSEAEAEAILGILMNLYNATLAELEAGSYLPILLSVEREDGSLPLPYGWCEGYLVGWNFHGEAVLDTMVEEQEAAALMGPVVAFLMYDEAQLMDPPDVEAHRATVAELGPSAVGLYRWWLPRRELPAGNA